MSKQRVLITGMGAVTPFGTGVDVLWEGLASGRDRVRPVERFDTTDYRVKVGGVVGETDFEFPEDRPTRLLREPTNQPSRSSRGSLGWSAAATCGPPT